MAYQELLPLLPGMTLSVPPGGRAGDLAIVRTLKEQLPDALVADARAEVALLERAVAPEIMPPWEVEISSTGILAAYPWKDGVPLAGALARAREAGLLPPIRVAGRIVLEALSALGVLHTLTSSTGQVTPVVHGAFRADSLWLGFDGKLQLCDLGFSSVGSRVETPSYAGRDPRADVHAAGVIAHVVLTGAMPTPSPVGSDPSQLNPEVSEAMAAVVRQATHSDPAARFANAVELKAAWEATLADIGGVATHGQVSRWLCTIFPANHPLVAALRATLQPLGGGAGLPTNEGPILSNPRLAPVRDVSSPKNAPVPTTSSPRNAPVPTTSSPKNVPVPSTSSPRMEPVAAPAPVPAPAPVMLATPAMSSSIPRAVTVPLYSAPQGVPLSQRTLPVPQLAGGLSFDEFGSAPTAAIPVVVNEAPKPAPDAFTSAPTAAMPAFIPPAPEAFTSAPTATTPLVVNEAPKPAADAFTSAPTAALSVVVNEAAKPAPDAFTSAPTAAMPIQQPAPSDSQLTAARAPTVTMAKAAPVVDDPVKSAPAPEASSSRNAPVNGVKRSTTMKRKAVAPPPEAVEPVDDLRPDPPAKSSSMKPLIIAVLGAVIGGGGVFALLQSRQQQPAPVEAPSADPLAKVETPPPPVEKPKEEKAAPVEKPAPKEPEKAREKAKPAPAPKKAAAAEDSGGDDANMATLSLNVQPWADVWVDGKKRGRTPFKALKLKPGKHVIRMENSEWHVKRSDTVELQPGGWGELNVTFTPP